MLLGIMKNKVTRGAILYTFLILFVYRIGSFIVTPGVDPSIIFSTADDSGLNAFFNLYGGGSISTLSLLALGVSPYVSASIIIQLLENELVPAMNEWKHQGVEGQNKRSKWIKILSLVLAFVQGLVIPLSSSTYVFNDSIFGYLTIALFMTAGTAIMMWLADRITEKGIGNGISVVIMAGILSRFPTIFTTAYAGYNAATTSSETVKLTFSIVALLILLLLVIVMVIYYSLATRRIKINYVRSGRSTVRKNSYIPVKLNPAGVIPVIFVSPIFILFNWLANKIIEWDPGSVFSNDAVFTGTEAEGWMQMTLSNMFNLQVTSTDVTSATTNEVYLAIAILPFILYFLTIVFFSIFYSYVQMNPENMAENLERQNAYVIGVRPGEETVSYVTNVVIRVSVWGGIILAFIATLPQILNYVIVALNINGISVAILGTGLIITVNVLVQTYKSLANKTESKKYRRLLGDL